MSNKNKENNQDIEKQENNKNWWKNVGLKSNLRTSMYKSIYHHK